MTSRDLKLLYCSISRKLDYFHTIEQWLRNGIGGIGCTHKKHIGKIIRNIHIMVCKASVLLRIQHFQKSTCRITAVIFGKLVHLIQYHNRICGSAPLHSFHNPAWHSTYVGSSVSSNFRFITDSTKTDTHVFTVKRTGNTLSDTGFSSSRCTYKQ